ncbi:MAG: phosphate signaling complex protein PhoU [Nitrosomonadales bacterium]|nr:phosphate signaling complex protein PhoU [Nitrosomonadales bacterium]
MHSNEHTSKQFDAELEAIRTAVLEMGELVKNQVSDAINSLVSSNVALVTRVMDDDYRVNAMEVRIDEVCTQVIACRQPTANDLRFVMTVIKTITDLERIGDEAKRIAHMAKMIWLNHGLTMPRYTEVKRASEIALDMLRKSLDAFTRLDVILAAQVVREDDQVDEKFRTILRNLVIFMMEDPRIISTALEMLFVAKAIERIGDHAQNMAEYVIYMVKGRDVRHVTVDEIEHEVQQQHSSSPS